MTPPRRRLASRAVDGIHDLGGREGFGPVVVEPDEPVFHEPWEGRVFALLSGAVLSGAFGTPQFRYAIERIPPAAYLEQSYYEHWLTALATLLVEREVIGPDELGGDFQLSSPARPDPTVVAGPDVTAGRYAVGDRVRVRNMHPRGHTRCPGYVRGRAGVVVRCRPPANLDDVEAELGLRRLDPLYCVGFEGRELWGGSAEPNTTVLVDLFESYLEEP